MKSMIILYDTDEKEFTSLGIGVLSDAISCVVSEELNGGFELEMEYPITGTHYSDLQETRIVLAKPNDFLDPQPFRIYKITRPIDGTVTVYGEHISYDMSKVPVRKFAAASLSEIAYTDANDGKLKESQIIDSPFKFKIGPDKTEGLDVTYQTKHPYNMRALLMGDDDSILKIYDGEFIFDKFDVTLCTRRGVDRDFTIRYSKNMIDLEQETTSELMYTGVCPYYSNTTTETKVGIGKKYKEIYISNEKVQPLLDVNGNTIYPSNWLTYKSTGIEAITDILSLTVTNIIASEGEFQNHLVRARKAIPQGSTEEGSYFFDATYNMAYINKNNVGGQDRYWLYKDIDLTECYEDPNLGNHVTHGDIFRIYTPGDNLYKVFVFDDSIGSDGEYRLITSDDNIEEYPPTIPSVDNTQEEKDNILTYEGDLIFIDEVRAIPKEGQEVYSATWLQRVEEQIQVINSDPRWKVPDSGGDIVQVQGVPSKIVYKVPSTEVATTAYPIAGKKEYARDWLTLTEGSNVPIPNEELIDGRPFDVPREDHTIYKCRWSSDDNKYNHRTDTRCTYTNYVWNGTSYVPHTTSNDKILTLDLSDKFKETPKNNQKFQKDLYDETMNYIKDAKLGTLKKSIKVSFVKLSSSPEYSKWKQLETVALGDVVHVIYEDLGVNEKKKVIKTEYNVLTETYDSIEIGDKGAGFVDTAVTVGDSVSALTNDRNFADITTVTKLVAERIEADYIHAVQAEITEAQIQTLTASELNATLITAQKFEIDKLVAGLLVADDAAIRNTLVVGDGLIVNGEVNINNGTISISGQDRIDSAVVAYLNPNSDPEDPRDLYWLLLHESDTEPTGIPVSGVTYKVEIDGVWQYYIWDKDLDGGHYSPLDIDSNVYFEVDESGNVTANSLEITGGSISIGDNFEVTNAGVLKAQEAVIEGNITATSGTIGECTIDEHGRLIVPMAQVTGTLSADDIIGGTITASSIYLRDEETGKEFSLETTGEVVANSVTITGGFIEIEEKIIVCKIDSTKTEFGADWLYIEDDQGNHETIVPEEYVVYHVDLENDEYKLYRWFPSEDPTEDGTYRETTYTAAVFSVDNHGYLTANNAEITGRIVATSGKIGDAWIVDGHLQVDNVDIKELSADRIKGGTLKSSEIRLDDAIEALSDKEVQQYSQNWLYQEVYNYEHAQYEKVTIIPKQNKYYYVDNTKYYIWNGTSYEEAADEPTYFEVNNKGNVTANSLEITGGKISIAGDSSLFSVDQYGTLSANSVKLTGGEIENLDITGYLFFKSKNYITAYTMTSIGTTSYSDGYLMYTSDNSYMEFNGDYSYENGVLILTSNAIEALSDEEVQQYSQNWLYQEVYNYEHEQYEKVTIVPEQNKYYYVDNTKYYIWNGTSYEESNANYHRNYIRYSNNKLNYSIYSLDRLSEHNPVTDEKEGPALTPISNKIYLVMDYKDGYSESAELLGLYKWDGTNYVKQDDSAYYISEDGFYLPYIKSTLTGAAIAGFDVDENTITSSTATTEVGLSSDTSEPAFWAGKANTQTGDHPFEVSQLGELYSISGNIGSFYIGTDKLTTNELKTDLYVNAEGLMIQSEGISFYNSTTETKVVIDSIDGILTPNILIDPFKRNINPNDYPDPSSVRGRLGARVPLLLNGFVSYLNDYEASSSKVNVWPATYFNWDNLFVQCIPTRDGRPIAIAANSTKTFLIPRHHEDIDSDTEIINVIASVCAKPNDADPTHPYDDDPDASWYYSHAPIVSFNNDVDTDEYRGRREIYVRNTNNETIYIKLVVIYNRMNDDT